MIIHQNISKDGDQYVVEVHLEKNTDLNRLKYRFYTVDAEQLLKDKYPKKEFVALDKHNISSTGNNIGKWFFIEKENNNLQDQEDTLNSSSENETQEKPKRKQKQKKDSSP